jgi:succinate dehydrogenase hydrophobic anchor subunit
VSGGNLAFGIEHVVNAVIDYGSTFVANDASRVGMLIFWLIFFFHVIEGAAEVTDDPGSCRLFKRKFWLRIILVAALLGGYQAVVVGTVATVQPKYMTAFTDKWAEVWVGEEKAIETIKNAEADNQDLKYNEVAATKTGHQDDSLGAKIARYIVDGLITALGWVLACATGGLITIFMLMEGFYGLGVNMVLIAVGPVCIAFAAHEKTEVIFWSYVRAFLVLGLLYMPMLGVACGFAGIIMGQMSTMVANSGVVYGDGSDIWVHLVMVVLGPICSFAVVRAVPAMMAQLLQSMSGGGGSTFAAGAGLAMMLARGGGGGSRESGGGGRGGPGGLDAAAERGRADAAIAALGRGGGAGGGGARGTGGGPGGPSEADVHADDVRGDS